MLEHTCSHMTMQAQASDLKKDFLSLNLQLKGNSAYLQVGFIAFPFRVSEVIVFWGFFFSSLLVCRLARHLDKKSQDRKNKLRRRSDDLVCDSALSTVKSLSSVRIY